MSEDIQMYNYSLGIDPGWKNLGLGIVRQKVDHEDKGIELVHSQVLNPSALDGILGTAETIKRICYKIVPGYDANYFTAALERYVPYNNVFTAEAENITMLIGCLTQSCNESLISDTPPALYRAIDWKMALVKALFKWKRFSNPSDKLDKKFSIAAAKACISNPEKEIETDHEADAICLASLRFVPGFGS
jgi:hypothetical protein